MMENFVSITGVTSDNRVAKYQPFALEADAVSHAANYNGFAAPNPGGSIAFWIVDADAKTLTYDAAGEQAHKDSREIRAVQNRRSAAYQSESDTLFFEEQAGEVAAGTWAAKRAEIKVRFPK
tara:strand:- start:161 stop:526 length:366 start_codon:yes stop_codon:yes gene_type:complete